MPDSGVEELPLRHVRAPSHMLSCLLALKPGVRQPEWCSLTSPAKDAAPTAHGFSLPYVWPDDLHAWGFRGRSSVGVASQVSAP